MDAMRSVLTLGETMVLVTPATAEPLELASDFQLEIGGAESNVASHLVRLGTDAAWASAVGDDALGRRLLATLRARGVDTSLVRIDRDAPTGVYFKDPAPEGSRVVYYRRGSAASHLGPEYAAALPIAESPLVHVSGITAALSAGCRALLEEVIRIRSAASAPLSFDVNYRPTLWASAAEAAEVLLGLARRATTVFVGRDEAEALWGTATAAEIRALLDGPRLIVKDGAVGAHRFDGIDEHFAPAHAVEVVEPVGAGDAFAAGYLAAELGGADPALALAAGHESAARVLMTTGDY
jgi:2-dehydro-3-deoxygluconokinase